MRTGLNMTTAGEYVSANRHPGTQDPFCIEENRLVRGVSRQEIDSPLFLRFLLRWTFLIFLYSVGVIW